MSVSVRLTRTGKKNAPSFRVVATKTRNKRDGQVLETLGFWNPSQGIGGAKTNSSQLTLNTERINYWRGVGALVSNAVEELCRGELNYVKYAPNKKKSAAAESEQK